MDLTTLQIPHNSRIAVVGYSGSGKSRVAQWIAHNLLNEKSAVLISDPMDCPQDLSIWRGWGVPCYDSQGIGEAWEAGERVVRLCTSDLDCIEDLLSLGAAIPNSLVVLDECQGLFPSNLSYCPEAFTRLVNQGRRNGQGLICLGQSKNQLPTAFRNQAIVFSANQSELSDKQWLKIRGVEGPIDQFAWAVFPPDGRVFEFKPLTESEIQPLRIFNRHLGIGVNHESTLDVADSPFDGLRGATGDVDSSDHRDVRRESGRIDGE